MPLYGRPYCPGMGRRTLDHRPPIGGIWPLRLRNNLAAYVRRPGCPARVRAREGALPGIHLREKKIPSPSNGKRSNADNNGSEQTNAGRRSLAPGIVVPRHMICGYLFPKSLERPARNPCLKKRTKKISGAAGKPGGLVRIGWLRRRIQRNRPGASNDEQTRGPW